MTHSTQTIRVHLAERSYDIEIGAGNLDRAGPLLTERARVTHAVVITDENVEEPHAANAAESLAAAGVEVDLVVVEPGEATKSIETAAALWEKLLAVGADRKSVVVAVGGGVVGDLAGFIAATYARGIRFFQVPTTLLAQVDSSVGGKVGINLPEAKNMVGAFLQPLGVLIDTATLETLDPREYRAGLGEVVKYGVILDAELFEYLEANVAGLVGADHDVLRHVIARCCQLKADVVEKDEREESGLRAVLNYGHTFGHAFEALLGYGELLHGEAVAIGMLCASRLAERLGRVDAELTARQHKLLSALGLPTEVPRLDADRILRSMMHDKKVQHGRLRFVLPDSVGHVELVGDVDPEDVRAALVD
ncbi:MAG TPA: 3-dehydroquinate synthase [Thermoguttaceae bacterium]|nr:3-dehydroquinate synthase [Thermoguttaceae bacterium]